MSDVGIERLSETPVPDGAVPRYELLGWREGYGVTAGVTGREQTFWLKREDNAVEAHAPAWSALQAEMRPGFTGIVVSAQEHGTTIRTYETPARGLRIERGLDGHITRQAGLLLAVTVADCIPVYIFHPPSGTAALLHAGWRGTAAGVLEAGVERICQYAGAAPSELVMHCGIGICGVCYQVGFEVFQAVTGEKRDDHRLLNLRENLARRGHRSGVGRVSVSAWCTAHDSERFHSYRRSGSQAGRMIAFLGRPAS